MREIALRESCASLSLAWSVRRARSAIYLFARAPECAFLSCPAPCARGWFHYLLLLSASESFLCSFGLRNAGDLPGQRSPVIGSPYIDVSSKALPSSPPPLPSSSRVSRIKKVIQSVSPRAKGERRPKLKSIPDRRIAALRSRRNGSVEIHRSP